MTDPKPAAILFWETNAFHIADAATKTELPGEFPELHDAWLAAHSLEMRVVAVNVTRGQVRVTAVKAETAETP